MKIKRTELREKLDVLRSLENIPNAKVFSFSVLVNKKRFLKRLSEIDVYRKKIYINLIKAKQKKNKGFDITVAEKMFNDFNTKFLESLIEKYSYTIDKDGKKIENKINGQLQILPDKIVDYNKEADKEYNRIVDVLKKDHPEALEVLEMQNKKMNSFMDKTVTIDLVMVNPKDLPETFTADQMEYCDFMINIPEEKEEKNE